jgi:hypothetical protein
LLVALTCRNQIIMVRSPAAASMISLIWLYLLLGDTLVVVSVTGSTASEFGTQDGYDVGGTKPICYVTNIQKDPNVPDTDGSNYTAIELLNDGMFGHKDKDHNNNVTGVSLLPSVRQKATIFRFCKKGLVFKFDFI